MKWQLMAVTTIVAYEARLILYAVCSARFFVSNLIFAGSAKNDSQATIKASQLELSKQVRQANR
jgi:hypothetical protein